MSLEENKHYSQVEKIKQERATVGVALLSNNPQGEVKQWCRVCPGSRLILQENNTIYFCGSCGESTPVKDLIHTTKLKARYGPAGSNKDFIVSQTQKQRRRGNIDDDEIAANIAGHITEEDIKDLRMLGINVTSVEEG